MAVIQDLASNPLSTQTSPMIGFSDVVDDDEELSLRIYRFVLQSIRDEDQKVGQQFLERFVEGSQIDWARTDSRIKALPSLSSVTDIEDQFLKFLKDIVGWTAELDNITDELDDETLRRLIAASVQFWKLRGPEDAVRDILRLVTAARLRTWNWFETRIVSDETAMGEDHEGFDPHMISLPGPPDFDENRYNVRIVDNGTLNRKLVRDLVRLTRPAGERVEISYLGFLDLFAVDDDNSQWTDEEDAFALGVAQTVSDVASSILQLATRVEEQESFVSVAGANDFLNYTVSWRVRGTDLRCTFYRTGNTDMYFVGVNHTANTMTLSRVLAGVETTLLTVDMLAVHGVTLQTDLFYAVRVEAIPESGQTRIRVYFDAVQIFDTIDPNHVEGTIGVGTSASGSVDLHEAEVFFNPIETDTIDINT